MRCPLSPPAARNVAPKIHRPCLVLQSPLTSKNKLNDCLIFVNLLYESLRTAQSRVIEDDEESRVTIERVSSAAGAIGLGTEMDTMAGLVGGEVMRWLLRGGGGAGRAVGW